jgi:hypothetical protein
MELEHGVRQAFVLRMVGNEIRIPAALQNLLLRGKVRRGVP